MSVKDVEFRAIPSWRLPRSLDRGINLLVADSIDADFEERGLSAADIALRVRASQLTRRNLNRGRGSEVNRHQQYARQLSMLAIRRGELVAVTTTADNASSIPKDSSPTRVAQSKLEIAAKLFDTQGWSEKVTHRDPLTARWRTFGLMAIAPSERERLDDVPSTEATVVTTLIAMGVAEAYPNQPVSAYPWKEEGIWKTGLTAAGLVPEPKAAQPRHIFTPGQDPVVLERWTASRAESCLDAIVNLNGSQQWLVQAGIEYPAGA